MIVRTLNFERNLVSPESTGGGWSQDPRLAIDEEEEGHLCAWAPGHWLLMAQVGQVVDPGGASFRPEELVRFPQEGQP